MGNEKTSAENIVLFGKALPEHAAFQSSVEAMAADVMLLIGTSGEVMPACLIPAYSKKHGATIIEINPNKSNYTNSITDVFLQGNAAEMMRTLENHIMTL